ncbi:MAG: gamma-glutamyltransferase [Opitutales bacterium]|nr:gamma-glutamyltransferase [Opitutales bacterium]
MLALVAAGQVPVRVEPVAGRHGMVVAGHPQAAQAGIEVLRAGGTAVDAAIAVSLSLGVAEPYGSGLGGKLMLLYYEAATGRTYALDAMDAAGSLEVAAYLRRPEDDHSYGYGAVCVPGLAAGLWTAHERWGRRKWADDVAPALRLARAGFEVLPKTREFFAEQEKKLRRGDAEIARLYLPGGQLPVVGTRLPNPDLAHTLELLAQRGRAGFYRGPAASQRGGGTLTLDDLARYEARVVEPIGIDFRGYQLRSSPPPTSGAPLFLTIMKVLEAETFAGGPLRSAANLDRLGRVWREVQTRVQRGIADVPEARFNFEKLVAPDSLREIRARASAPAVPAAAGLEDSGASASAMAATTHFLVADAAGNLVCATQSQSLHFGAGVVPPGTGVVLNDSMSNFAFTEPRSVNFVAPGTRHPRRGPHPDRAAAGPARPAGAGPPAGRGDRRLPRPLQPQLAPRRRGVDRGGGVVSGGRGGGAAPAGVEGRPDGARGHRPALWRRQCDRVPAGRRLHGLRRSAPHQRRDRLLSGGGPVRGSAGRTSSRPRLPPGCRGC